jgi:hypothetical protein
MMGIVLQYMLQFIFCISPCTSDDWKHIVQILISPAFTMFSAFVLYRYGTRFLSENSEVSKFHEKYINIKNEISIQKSNIQVYGVYAEDFLDLYMKAHIKFINLLFEEILCSKNNKALKNKLFDPNSKNNWIASTCKEIISNLECIDIFSKNTESPSSILQKFSLKINTLYDKTTQSGYQFNKKIDPNVLFLLLRLIGPDATVIKAEIDELEILNEITMSITDSFKDDLISAKLKRKSKSTYQLVI